MGYGRQIYRNGKMHEGVTFDHTPKIEKYVVHEPEVEDLRKEKEKDNDKEEDAEKDKEEDADSDSGKEQKNEKKETKKKMKVKVREKKEENIAKKDPESVQLDISLDLPGNFKLGSQRIIDLISDNNQTSQQYLKNRITTGDKQRIIL